MLESRSVGIAVLLIGSIWQANGISPDISLRPSTPIVLCICWLMTLKLGGVLLSGLWISLRVEVVGILNLESPIVIHVEIWLLSSLVVVVFVVDDDLKPSCQVFAANPLNSPLLLKPERNCPSLPPPG